MNILQNSDVGGACHAASWRCGGWCGVQLQGQGRTWRGRFRFARVVAAVAVWALAMVPSVLFAQYDTDFQNSSFQETKDEPRKKEPGIFFHRPQMDTPAAQLALADKLRAAGKNKAAMKQYNALVHKWHISQEAPTAQLAYARLLYEAGKYTDAFDEYQYLVVNFAGQFPYEEALERQFQIANHQMTARRLQFLFFPGFKIQEQALPLFEKIVKNAPGWKNSVEAQFNIGLINEALNNFPEAIRAYDYLRYRYPDSEKAAEANFRRAYCLYLSAEEAPRDETACRQALSALAGFIADFPRHEKLGQAKECRDKLDERLANMYYERALFYEKTPGRKKAAIIAYEDFIRKYPSSKLVDAVSRRIETLKVELENKK